MARYERLNVGELIARKLRVDRGDEKSNVGVLKALTGDIAYDVADPYTVSLGIAPKGTKLVEVIVDIETAFNAATTNVLVVGTSGDDDAFVAAADVDESSASVQVVAGNLAEFSADTEIFAKFTQTGTAATAGLAHITAVIV